MPLVVRKRLSNHSTVKDLCLVNTNFLLLIGREITFSGSPDMNKAMKEAWRIHLDTESTALDYTDRTRRK